MTTLLLRLAAPLQSWGTSSRFVRRNTDRHPSRSGIIGLLAAARGQRRTDPLEELLELRVGVRIEQPGRLERDFHTARTRDGRTAMPLSYRFYLADAVFLAAVEGPHDLVHGLHDALRRPAFPLYLGRRSCPPAGPLDPQMRPATLGEVLADEPWQAADRIRRAHRDPWVRLETVVDHVPEAPHHDVVAHQSADSAEDGPIEVVRDDPISFDPRRREYGWREVVHRPVVVANPSYTRPTAPPSDSHDPFAALEEAD